MDMSNKFSQDALIFFLKNLEPASLPGTKAHQELTPYRQVPVDTTKIPENARRGAVAVIMGYQDGQPVVLLTKRTDYKGIHGGQISFPGGKAEESDKGLLYTAMRETQEETGLVLDENECMMPLSGIYIPPSNFYVQPYLFITSRPFELTINHEVDYPIIALLGKLMADEALQKTDIRLSDGLVIKNAPCFIYEQHMIWGATAAMLNELKWMLRPFIRT